MGLPFIKRPAPLGTLFSVQGDSGGLATLPTELTINGTTVSADLFYQAKDATTSSWTATAGSSGGTLTGAGSGGTVDLDSPTPNSLDRVVDSEVTRYWSAGDNDAGDIANEDFVFEVVCKTINDGAARTICKYIDTALGWALVNTNTAIRFLAGDGADSFFVSHTTATNTWNHVLIFCDRSAPQMRMYVNGVFVTSDASPNVGSLSIAQPVTVGAESDGGGLTRAAIAHFALWKADDWLDSATQNDLALERYARVAGVWSTQATIQSNSRSTAGYLDRVSPSDSSVRKIHYVAPGWHRQVRRPDIADTVKSGYLSEQAGTNLCLQSEDLSTTWTTTGVTITTNDTAAPNGETTADSIDEDGTTGQHYVQAGNISWTSGTQYAISVWAKKNNRDWLRVNPASTVSPTNSYAYFDLDNGVVGTVGAGADSATIEDWGNGWYRCVLIFTCDATNSAAFFCQVGEADDDNNFTGLSQASLYVWGVQCEAASAASSYIPTTTGTVTRTADDLEYNTTVDLSKGTLACDILVPKGIDASNERLIWITDDTNNNRISAMVDATEESLRSIMIDGGVTQANVTSYTELTDGYWHEARSTWAENAFHVYVNGNEEGTPDTSCTVPSGLDKIHIGNEQGAASPSNGVVINPRLYKKPTLKNVSINLSGIADLPQALYINKQSVDPTYWYEARNASLTDWTGTGGTLTGAGSGGTADKDSPTANSADRAFDCERTRYFEGGVDTWDQEDAVFEAVFYKNSGTVGLAQAIDNSVAHGWYFDISTNANLKIDDGTTLANIATATSSTDSGWFHLMVFLDRSGSAQCYLNGVASGSSVSISSVGSLLSSETFRIGNRFGTNTGSIADEIALFAMWKSSGWLDTHLQPNVAASRYAILGLE